MRSSPSSPQAARAAPLVLAAVLSCHGAILAADAFPPRNTRPTPCFLTASTSRACRRARPEPRLRSTVEAEAVTSGVAVSPSPRLVERFLDRYEQSLEEGRQWAAEFGFAGDDDDAAEGAFYAAFRALRRMDAEERIGGRDDKLLGLDGTPFYVPASSFAAAEGSGGRNLFSDYFHFPHLAAALEEDFLDAQRGSTDNRKGWQVAAVSQPTGSSFDDARMTLAQVKTALESGTVIFNNIGAHIPRLAGPTLACTDALYLPGALNMYVTARGMRTSAPPHTDRQDVLVVQMEGAKRWRVFSPPTDGDVKPSADPFARGKGDDSLPLHKLLEGREGRLGTELLADVVTREGDVLFIPAGFPHATDTVEDDEDAEYDASIHLTFNIDTHVWDLDNLSVRSAALKRSGASDVLASPSNRYVGKVNQLPAGVRSRLMDALPLEFLEANGSMNPIAERLEGLCSMVNEATDGGGAAVSTESLRDALGRVHSYGSSILDIHRDMYIAAVEEGRLRAQEAAMTAHIKKDSGSSKVMMTPARMQRLSLFRVKPFFERIDAEKKELERWCLSGNVAQSSIGDPSGDVKSSQLDPNWQFTTPLKVGDEVEADLGGAFFEGKIAQVVGSTYNVVFFDGDRENGLERDQIKLLNPPSADDDEIDTTGLTPKEIKKLRKKMQKKGKKKGKKGK